jgi:putative phage-type endonuclease
LSAIVETYDSREGWLAARQQSIGASEAAAVVGLAGYKSPYAVWVDKTEPPVFEPMDEIARWGLLLEPAILKEFVHQAGVAADRQPSGSVWRDPQRPYITATPDAISDKGEPVELKTAHFGAAKVWKNEVPIAYMVQVQHQLHVTEAEQGFIAVLVDGYQFAWHRVKRHQVFIDRLIRKLEIFWKEYVLKRIPPPTDWSEATTKALLRKYPTANGSVVELPDEFEVLYDEMKSLTAAETAASRRKEEIKNAIRERMGDNRYGYLASGKGFQWSGENGSRRFTLTERCPEPSNSH